MWELVHKESWVPKNWCFLTVVLKKTLESPVDYREIQLVHSKDLSWVFFGRTDAEAEAPILWPPHAKSWLTGKDFDAGRDWGQEKGMTEGEMAGWHHWLDAHESEWTPGVGDGQGGLACCDSWGCKESDTTEWLNWTKQEPASSQKENLLTYTCYAFGVAHDFGILWKLKSFGGFWYPLDAKIFRKAYQKHKTSSRITICNSAMNTLAIIKVSGHRKAETAEAKRNFCRSCAKTAALQNNNHHQIPIAFPFSLPINLLTYC